MAHPEYTRLLTMANTPLLKLDVPVSLLEVGATKPARMRAEDGTEWVFKGIGNPLGTKAVFSEFLGGSLACWLGIPWPRTRLAQVVDEAAEWMNSKAYELGSRVGVATRFHDALEAVPWPDDGYQPMQTFPSRNKRHLRSLFPCGGLNGLFAGKWLFDHWVLMEDDKYDTLKRDHLKTPLFLDASAAFGGHEWDLEKLNWREVESFDYTSPYLQGIVNDVGDFGSWIERLEGFSSDDLRRVLNQTPTEWEVPTMFTDRLFERYASTASNFTALAKVGIEWRAYVGWM